jgi:glycosyltransferase involved in cell wall biosynthesis
LEPLDGHYQRRLHGRADLTFVTTRALRERLEQQGFRRVEMIGRGVDPLFFWPGRRSAVLRRAWGAACERDPVLLHVGALEGGRNIGLALRAFDALRYVRPGTRMVVVGEGPLRARLQSHFPAVHFAGIQRDEALAQHYASADVLVLPGLAASSGNVLLEAMASGLVVVAFAAGEAREHVRSGIDGVLVEPGDEAGFIGAVARAAALAEPGSLLRLRARDSALRARWDTVLRQFEARLAGLAVGEGRARHAVPRLRTGVTR